MSKKLTNYQLNLVVNKIYDEVVREISKKNAELKEQFSFEDVPECVESLELLDTYIDLNKQISEIAEQQFGIRERLIKLKALPHYGYITNHNIKDSTQMIKNNLFDAYGTQISFKRSDIELAVLSNQHEDIGELINKVIKQFTESI